MDDGSKHEGEGRADGTTTTGSICKQQGADADSGDTEHGHEHESGSGGQQGAQQ